MILSGVSGKIKNEIKNLLYILPPWTSQISVTSLPSLYGSINFVRSLLLASYITGFWGGTGTKKRAEKNCMLSTTWLWMMEKNSEKLGSSHNFLFTVRAEITLSTVQREQKKKAQSSQKNVLKMSWIISDRIFHFLTYNCKINFEIPCWWVSKIYATSVHAFVAELDIINKQLRRMRRCAEKCSSAKSSWWWP